jgi:hypothetical protein
MVQTVTVIYFTAAFVVLYFSCRCKHEHFDLQLLAGGVVSALPAAGVPAADNRLSVP